MPRYGDKWVDDLYAFVRSGTPMPPERASAMRAQLRELVDVLNERAEEEEPEPPPPVVRSVWDGFGWMREKYEGLWDPQTLKACGVTWVAACLHHGFNADGSQNLSEADAASQAWLAAGKAEAYRAAGIKVGGWAWHERGPEREADVAHICITNWHLDFWIANAEVTWKQEPGGVLNAPERYALRLHPLLPPGFPVAWSPLGAASGTNVFPYDYAAFTRRGWHVLPQAYPQQDPSYALPLVLDHAGRAGLSLRYVHPTIANYEPQKAGAFKPSIASWRTELLNAFARGAVGASLWDQPWAPDEVRALSGATRG